MQSQTMAGNGSHFEIYKLEMNPITRVDFPIGKGSTRIVKKGKNFT